jgi:hypothetical protein
MADVGDSEGAIEILSELLDRAPDAFTFRFRAELRLLRQDFEGAKSGIVTHLTVHHALWCIMMS